ncbi:pentatricopeptide repeat-containing protein [Cinnamomum micranthum f. kanehirae]|uniref:Pentatricopeptide repeat-containing protein n=1 Tax=Cinnamomum micranthum f. kanehirae TaxID=337451 RepID=A0A443NIY1_9MAGN|nr:pentatricopeptide repeat-containing protein [Cinnamomum micranthum f. kanehirae]
MCFRTAAPFLSAPKSCNWNLMIRESTSKMQWEQVLSHFHEMNKARVLIDDPLLFPPIFKACAKLGSFRQGISLHASTIKKGFDSYPSIANSTMDFYFKCGAADSALSVFYCMGRAKDSVSWNVAIHGLLDQGASEEGLLMFIQARLAGFESNVSNLVLVLQACRSLGARREGVKIHGFIIRSGFSDVVSVQNSLLSLYVKSQDMESAHQLFDEMPQRDLISWSVMISGYARCGKGQIALQLFQEMRLGECVDLDGLTVVSVIQACTSFADIDQGRLIHSFVIRRGFEFDLHVGNALVDLYCKCMDVEAAHKVFNNMLERNIVSWNSMLSGLIYNGKYSEALELFYLMEKAGIEVDEITVVNLLQSYKNLGHTLECKCIHSVIIRRGFDINELVLNSLLDAYAKCNLVELAWKLFDSTKERDLFSWSAMIGGFAHCGRPDEAMALYQEMKMAQQKPNSVTMLSLLEACSISADLERLKWAHCMAIRNGMMSEVAVGTAILETYAKCGEVDESRRVFNEMPERNIVSWSAMIAAYGMNGCARDALAMLRDMQLHDLKPNKITILSVLSACSHGGLVAEGLSCFKEMIHDYGLKPSSEHYSCLVDMLGRAGDLDGAIDVIRKMPGGGLWDDAARMRWLVKEKQVRVVAGYSLVHVNSRAYKFVSGDTSHQQSTEIYGMVEHMHNCMREQKNDTLLYII